MFKFKAQQSPQAVHGLESEMVNHEMSNLCLVSFQSSGLFVFSPLFTSSLPGHFLAIQAGRDMVHSKRYYTQAWI